MIPVDRVYLDAGSRISGRHDPPRRCVVITSGDLAAARRTSPSYTSTTAATRLSRFRAGCEGRPRHNDGVTPRCIVRGCPVRYRSGADRPCAIHLEDGDTLAARMEAFTAMSALPGGRADDIAGNGDGRAQQMAYRQVVTRSDRRRN